MPDSSMANAPQEHDYGFASHGGMEANAPSARDADDDVISNVRFPRYLYDQLKAKADENERAIAAEIRMAVKAWVKAERPPGWRPPDPGRVTP